jgi:ABC-type transport system substrate-binding protein
LVVPTSVDSPNTTCERDVEGAKKLLDEAGWKDEGGARTKDGKAMTLYFQTSINTLRQGEQAIIKANLAEVGIAVNLKAVDAGVFFSVLLSLSKFMQYEQRDPFQQKQDQLNNPDMTDWDRFCLAEYVRLAMEAGDSNQAAQPEALAAEDFRVARALQ